MSMPPAGLTMNTGCLRRAVDDDADVRLASRCRPPAVTSTFSHREALDLHAEDLRRVLAAPPRASWRA